MSGNLADNEGGGISNYQGSVTLRESSAISGNIAADFGGGIVNAGALTIDASTVTGNRAGFGGGAIYNWSSRGTVTIQNSSTVRGNVTQVGGAS